MNLDVKEEERAVWLLPAQLHRLFDLGRVWESSNVHGEPYVKVPAMFATEDGEISLEWSSPDAPRVTTVEIDREAKMHGYDLLVEAKVMADRALPNEQAVIDFVRECGWGPRD